MYGSQFLNGNLSSPYVAVGVHGIDSYGASLCSCIAASAVTGFQVEPGGYSAWVARFSPG